MRVYKQSVYYCGVIWKERMEQSHIWMQQYQMKSVLYNTCKSNELLHTLYNRYNVVQGLTKKLLDIHCVSIILLNIGI